MRTNKRFLMSPLLVILGMSGIFMGIVTLLMSTAGASVAQAAFCTHTVGGWERIADLPEPKIEALSVVYNDDIYVLGGFVNPSWGLTNRFDVYDPESDTWTRLRGYPDGAITHAGIVVDEARGDIWVAGGFLPQRPTTRGWRYDISEDAWYRGPDLPDERASAMLVKHGDNIHLIGGIEDDRSTDADDHWVLDLSNPTAWQDLAPLPRKRNHASIVVMGDEIHVIAGMFGHNGRTDGSGLGIEDVKIVDVYDIPSDTWREAPELNHERSHMEPGTVLNNGRVLLVGGRNYEDPSTGWALDTITEYDPNTGQSADIATLRYKRLAAISAVIDGYIYSIGGSNQSELSWRAPISYACDDATLGVSVAINAVTEQVLIGETATFEVTVRNMGDVRLNVDVVSATVPECTRTLMGVLAGEERTYTCTLPNIQQALTNTVNITASTPYGDVMGGSANISILAVDETPTETATETETETATITETETATATETATETAPPTAMETATETATETEATTATAVPTNDDDDDSDETSTATITETATGGDDDDDDDDNGDDSTETVTPIGTDEVTPEVTPEPTPSATETVTVTSTAELTPEPTDGSTETATATDEVTPTTTEATETAIPTVEITPQPTDDDPETPQPTSVPPTNPDDDDEPEVDLDDSVNTPTFPDFVWTPYVDENGNVVIADWYHVVVLNGNGDVILDIWVAGSEICSNGVCIFTPDATTLPFGLFNDTYTWWIQAVNEDADAPSVWVEGTPFEVAVALPVPRVETETGRIVLVIPDDPQILWVQIWMGTPTFETKHLQWYEKTTAVCDGETCTLLLDAHPQNGNYMLYMRPWTVNGFHNNDARYWAGPLNFGLSFNAPPPVSGMAVNTQSNPPTLTWDHTPGTTWYQFWGGSPAPDYVTAHTRWYSVVELDCVGQATCSLTLPDALAAGDYTWFMRAWNPGGLNDWVEGVAFEVD